MTRRIVHIAEVDLGLGTGMGRVGWHWQDEARRRGVPFLHIGPADVASGSHPQAFPAAALRTYRRIQAEGDCLLVHEPASGAFVGAGGTLVAVSHGLERRGWQARCAGDWGADDVPPLKTRLLFPLWRLRGADRGLRHAAHLFVLNRQDASFAETFYHRAPDTITVLRHGAEPTTLTEDDVAEGPLTALFLGSWIARKGVHTLVSAAGLLAARGVSVRWILAGTGASAQEIRHQFPEGIRDAVEVIPTFSPTDEEALLRRAHAFVLPSVFEGQPLALLQAMAAGRCCVTTDCCGQRDLIEHDRNGVLCASGDAEGLAAELGRVASDGGLRHRLGRQARLALDGRTWEAAFTQLWQSIGA
jgi:glycosyltransferase involved in cell wall biosynthesis